MHNNVVHFHFTSAGPLLEEPELTVQQFLCNDLR